MAQIVGVSKARLCDKPLRLPLSVPGTIIFALEGDFSPANLHSSSIVLKNCSHEGDIKFSGPERRLIMRRTRIF
jgi:hypothetical protein